MSILFSFCFLSLLLFLGTVLRLKLKFLQKLCIPSSIIGGGLGLIFLNLFPDTILSLGWSKLPGFLINIIFAALFIGAHIPSLKKVWQTSSHQLIYGQIVAWGQYVVGLGLSIFILSKIFNIERFFGAIMPVGFEGGHGTASGLKDILTDLGWQAGGDLAITAATIGITSAVILGVILINWAMRRGHVSLNQEGLSNDNIFASIISKNKRNSIGSKTISSVSVDTLAFHITIVGLAIFLGVILKYFLVFLESVLPISEHIKIFSSMPVFPLAMIGGIIVQLFIRKIDDNEVIQQNLIHSISGTALDFLVVAAISTIKIAFIIKYAIPFLVICLFGVLWNIFCVLYLSRIILKGKKFWFERAIVEMGQSMGVTATGILLLRIVDPDQKTTVYSDFGYKQMLHEPFMGGGIWTSIAIPLAITKDPIWIFLISLGMIILWILLWYFLKRK
ncbi:MAG: sodium:glutamate symporter [bacterium]|nr:sodium:glutamate symporter [bacterium]